MDPRYKNNQSIFTPTERSRNKTLLTDSIKSVINPERRPSDSIPNVIFPLCHDTDDLIETFLNAAEKEPTHNLAETDSDSQTAKISEEIEAYFMVVLYAYFISFYFELLVIEHYFFLGTSFQSKI